MDKNYTLSEIDFTLTSKKTILKINLAPLLKLILRAVFVFFFLLSITLKAQCAVSAGTLAGDQYLCTYGKTSVNFNSTRNGGIWSTDRPDIAKISPTGNVSAVSKGIATMTYSIAVEGCPTVVASRKVYVSNGPAAGPISLSGSNIQCQGTTSIYSIVPDPYSSTYVWSYTGDGATISPSADGLSASITFSSTATSGNLIVSSTNGCGSAGGQYLYITVNPGIYSVPVATGAGNLQCVYAEPKWNTVQNAEGYYYDIATDNLFTKFIRRDIYVSGNNGSGQADNLPPGILYFRVRATNSCLTTVNSNVVKFSTKASFAGSTSADTNICSGTNTIVGVSGSVGSLQWQQSSDGTTDWKNVSGGSGGKTENYTTPNLTATTYYRAIADTGAGGCSPATSSIVKITVKQNLIASVSIATPNNIICAGTRSSLTFTASPTNGGTPVYQWKVNGNPAGINTNTFTSTTLNPGDIVTVEMVSNETPCLTNSPVTSNPIKVTTQTTVFNGKWSIPPTPELSAEIRSNYTSTNNENLNTCSLLVTNNTVIKIKAGDNVTVQNNITVDPGSVFILESDADLFQINPSAINSGNITAQRSVSGLVFTPGNGAGDRKDYVYWSSPVSGQKTKGADGFSPGTPNNRFYTYRESNDRFYETGDLTFQNGKGYAVQAEARNLLGSPYNKIFEFKGTPNNGDISYKLAFSGSTHGFNLVGNPYPSNITFDELYKNNSDAIWNTAYFWTNNVYEANQKGSGYSGNNYAVYNGAGGNSATRAAIGTGENKVPNGIVNVGQGFIVQAKAEGQLNFKNSYSSNNILRIKSAGIFFNKGETSPEKNRFWIKLLSPSQLVNTQLIAYVEGASNNFEQDYDAEALGLSSDLFYSVLADKKLLIQGRDDNFTEEDVVPLGANFFEDGTYTIALENAEGLFKSDQIIYLKDKAAGILTNLNNNSYKFTVIKGLSENRFEIVYKPEAVLATGNTSKETLQVYREDGNFIINADDKIADVELYDASGRLILKLNPNTMECKIDANRLSSGVFILKIKLSNGEILTKKIRK